ncbi:MAG: hypothetical protein NTZ10_05190 [Candidatus Saganbacteria bacterium]|nr:hypothetical protein [Candidatus Saganbacteria bacterium]
MPAGILKYSPNTLVFLKVPSLGGRICFNPVLRALRKNFPDSRIGVVVREEEATFYQHNPFGVKVHTVLPEDVKTSSMFDAKTEMDIRSEMYDTAIVTLLSENWLCDLAVNHAVYFDHNIGYYYSQHVISRKLRDHPPLEGQPYLFDATIKSSGGMPYFGEYAGLHYLRYLEPFGITGADHKPEVWSTDKDRQAISNSLELNGFSKNDFILGINIGGMNNVWPIKKYAEIIKQFESLLNREGNGLVAGRPVKYMALVGETEEEIWRLLTEYTKDFGQRFIGMGTPTPDRLAAAVERCSWLVTTENGAAHVAQALDIPATVMYPDETWKKSWLLPGARVKPVVTKSVNVSTIMPEDVNLATWDGIREWISPKP